MIVGDKTGRDGAHTPSLHAAGPDESGVSMEGIYRILDDLRRTAFPDLKPFGEREYRLKDGYHCFDFDRKQAVERFERLAPGALSEVISLIGPVITRHFTQIAEKDTQSLFAIRESGWVIAYQNELSVDLRLSGRSPDFLVAAPGLSVLRNIDTRPLRLVVYPISTSFELDETLNLEAVERICLEPGEQIVVNGFEQIIAYDEPGLLLAVIATLPLGAYESIYLLPSGKRAGVFSADVRASAISVALRVLAAAQCPEAAELAEHYRDSALKEIRWDVMNYAWRTDLPMLRDLLELYSSDISPTIAQIAQGCLRDLTKSAA